MFCPGKFRIEFYPWPYWSWRIRIGGGIFLVEFGPVQFWFRCRKLRF